MTKTQFTPGKVYLIVGAILGLTLLFPYASYLLVSTPRDSLEAERERNRWKVHHELDAANKQLAENFGWVDEKAGIVRVPLARAIDLELPVLAASKPRAGAPLVAPAAPAPAPTNAPVAPAPAGATNAAPKPAAAPAKP